MVFPHRNAASVEVMRTESEKAVFGTASEL